MIFSNARLFQDLQEVVVANQGEYDRLRNGIFEWELWFNRDNSPRTFVKFRNFTLKL